MACAYTLSWEKKVAKKTDMQDLESAWIYHELGRCYLETDNVTKAKEYGEKSYGFAQSVNDEVWQLNSSVLIAQSQGLSPPFTLPASFQT